jgi:hypothetical protein
VRGIRNLIILARVLGAVEPETDDGFVWALAQAIAVTTAHESKPPGFWGVLKKFGNKDFRRRLLLINSLIEAVGKNFGSDRDEANKPPDSARYRENFSRS